MSQPSVSRSRLWTIWVVGLAASVVGVMHRTSFGIAGLVPVARRRPRRELGAEGVRIPPLREVLARRRR